MERSGTTKKICVSKSAAQTKRLGFLLARAVLDFNFGKRAVVLALRGELGAGKTQFAQGFARALGIKGTVNSPTFVILKRYCVEHPVYKMFYHVDLYRLNSENELASLGISRIAADPKNIIIVEWPDIGKKMFSNPAIVLDFKVAGKNNRQIEFNAF